MSGHCLIVFFFIIIIIYYFITAVVFVPEQGSLTIVRRSSNSGGRRSPGSTGGFGGRQGPPWNSPPSSIDLEGPSSGTSSPISSMTMAIAPSETDSVTGAVHLATENLPAVDTPDACDKAALR